MSPLKGEHESRCPVTVRPLTVASSSKSWYGWTHPQGCAFYLPTKVRDRSLLLKVPWQCGP